MTEKPKRARSSTLGKNSNNPMIPEIMAEKKNALYEKQAIDYVNWISSYLKIEPFKDLLGGLRSGKVLLKLLQKIDPTKFKDLKFPKHIGDEENTFQIHENVTRFLAGCKQLGISERNLFSVDDLILENNKHQVLRTLQCLRLISEGNSSRVETLPPTTTQPSTTTTPTQSTQSTSSSTTSSTTTTASTSTSNTTNSTTNPTSTASTQPPTSTSTTKPIPSTSSLSTIKLTVPLKQPPPPSSMSTSSASFSALKATAQARKRSVRLFDGVGPVPFGMEKRPSKYALGLSDEPDPDDLLLAESKLASAKDEGKKSREDLTKIKAPTDEKKDNDKKDEEEEEEEEEESDDDDDFSENSEFVEQLTPDIMAHLLSKHVTHLGEEDYDEVEESSDEDDEPDEDEEADEDEIPVFQEQTVIHKQDELIKTLMADNDRLQEIIETKIVFHVKEMDAAKEREDTLNEKVEELEARAEAAEKRAREAEAKVSELKEQIAQKEITTNLISRSAREREQALVDANLKIAELLRQLGGNPSLIKPSNESKEEINIPEPQKTEEVEKVHSESQSQPQPPQEEQENNKSDTQPKESNEDKNEQNEQIEEPESKKAITLETNYNVFRQWKQLADAIPLLEKMSQTEIDRQEVIYELIATEASYNRDLNLVLRKFVEPLREKAGKIPKFNNTDFEAIFRNIENIARVNEAFLLDLQERSNQEWPVIKRIGDIIIKHAPFFDVYADYCGDQQRSVTEMRRAENDCPPIKEHLQKTRQDKECRKLDIYAFLLLPMQRITKYPLLLKNLLKKTENKDQDYEYLKAAASEIDTTIQSINDHTRRRDEIARLLEIGNQLDCSSIKLPINLSNSQEKGRAIIREGLLTRLRLKSHKPEKNQEKGGRKLEKLYIFFFTDMIVITKVVRSTPEGPPRYVVQVKPLKFSEIAVRNVPDASSGIGAKNVFLLSSKHSGTLVLQANSEEEKNLWINDFRKEDLIVKSLLKLEAMDGANNKVTLEDESQNKPRLPQEKENQHIQKSISIKEPVSSIPKNIQEDEEFRGRSLSLPARQRPISTASVTSNASSTNSDSSAKEDEKKSRLQNWLLGAKKPEQFIDISVSQLSEPEFDGYLKVLSKGAFQRAVWKWRYCVLKDFTLYFFLNEDPESRGTSILLLTGYTITAQTGKKKNIFELRHPTNPADTLILSADTAEYMNVWIEALTHATLARTAPRTFWL